MIFIMHFFNENISLRVSKSFGENSLFDTGKMSRSFLGPEIFFVPYLTLTSTFIPNLTLPSNPLANGVN